MIDALAIRAEAEARAWIAARRSPRTRAAYASDIRAVGRAIAANQDADDLAALGAVLRADLGALAAWRDRELEHHRPATVARRIASLRTFYRYAQSRGLRSDNPAAHLEAPRVNPEEQRRPWLERSDIRALIRAAGAGRAAPHATRNRAAIWLAAGCGLRRSEIASLRVRDFDQVDRTILVHGKGEKVRTLTIPESLAADLAELAAGREPDAPILALAPGHFARVLRRAAHRAGLDPAHVTPHALRRSWVTICNDEGRSRADLVRAGGWADGRTLDRYDRRRAAAVYLEF
jgi:integrase/recombinase XerD